MMMSNKSRDHNTCQVFSQNVALTTSDHDNFTLHAMKLEGKRYSFSKHKQLLAEFICYNK